ncbi:hypothetical protein KAR91_84975 [Candidatus Pacearchaeota archaeon]|nr:hypothetical protein [Candidatus Pacearchaeota archaeon]
MSNFWPTNLNIDEILPPIEILKSAQNEWSSKSEGILELILYSDKSTDENKVITVIAKHIPSNRTTALFEVLHRQSKPYPATLVPKEWDTLPNSLKKSYYSPGTHDFASVVGSVSQALQGREIKNNWVTETPSEFKNKLNKMFNLGVLKTEIVNLIAEQDNE